MGNISLDLMKRYLSLSLSSINRNKLNGLLAEVDFRRHLDSLGFGDRVSPGGWIVRSTVNTESDENFSGHVVALFPHCIEPGRDYSEGNLPNPPMRLHTICSTFHQLGIHSYYCHPVISNNTSISSIRWNFIQLGLPTDQAYQPFPFDLPGFSLRQRNYNFLRYKSDISQIPEESVAEEFSKEHIRVSFNERFMGEISDVDGVFWGNRYTYPLEIKEKTAAYDSKLGEYFGLDLGPFVKLAFYAARHGTLHSIFIVREIDNTESRNLVAWRFITFDTLAQYASWVPSGGGRNMLGGNSTVVRIPKSSFTDLNQNTLREL